MPKFDDYWFDEHDGRPPYEGGHHGEPHEHPYDDYPHDHHPYPPFDGRRHRPVDIGKVDTTKMHDRYDMFVPHHMPPWGFKFPKLEKAFVPGSTPQEQVAYLLNRVDTMIDYFNHYDDKVWGAYNAVVHSALGNEAYYREITREEGYLADGSTPYTVIHIPYLDRADRPIFLELGLAYNNTTNNGVKENVFEASQNRVADKLIPAFNISDGWEGKAMLKGAPIQSTYTEGKFTLAVTDNGFLKIYPNTVSYDQLNRDRIRNAMGAQGVLINNGTKTPEQYATNGGELLARVGIGMNYETKERLIVIVNGNPTPPNNASVTGATADMLADIFAKYNCTVAVETANNGSAVAMDKGQMIYMPDTATTGVIPTVPSINCYWYITKRRHYHNQYVKDVADLIQKVGQNKWRCEIALQSCDFLKGRVNDLQRDLDAEVQARQNADEQLQNNIDAEAEARRLADVQLQDNIDAETNARVAGDNALDERITDEVSTLNTRIDAVVDDFNNAIVTERQARIDGDSALGIRIDNEVATINDRIDTEVATLNALIDAEEQARIAGDTALQNSLTQLRKDYTAFLTTYADDLAETRRITTALRNDITTIQGQIAELQSNLSAVNASITAILATINSVEQSFENIKTAFTELQEDWHDYKDSVDAEITQLMQDIADLNSQTHDTVADMKADTNLKAGMYVRTGGYYTVNDGGGALYRIYSATPVTYYETLSNGLYAELITGEYVNPAMYGAVGDGVTDDYQSITLAISSGRPVDMEYKTYYCGTSISIPSECVIKNGKLVFPPSPTIYSALSMNAVHDIELDNIEIVSQNVYPTVPETNHPNTNNSLSSNVDAFSVFDSHDIKIKNTKCVNAYRTLLVNGSDVGCYNIDFVNNITIGATRTVIYCGHSENVKLYEINATHDALPLPGSHFIYLGNNVGYVDIKNVFYDGNQYTSALIDIGSSESLDDSPHNVRVSDATIKGIAPVYVNNTADVVIENSKFVGAYNTSNSRLIFVGLVLTSCKLVFNNCIFERSGQENVELIGYVYTTPEKWNGGVYFNGCYFNDLSRLTYTQNLLDTTFIGCWGSTYANVIVWNTSVPTICTVQGCHFKHTAENDYVITVSATSGVTTVRIICSVFFSTTRTNANNANPDAILDIFCSEFYAENASQFMLLAKGTVLNKLSYFNNSPIT